MPVAFKYKDLRNQDCGVAIRKIKAAEGFPDKTAYHAMKLIKWVGEQEKIAQSLFEKTAHEFAEKNEDGTLKIPEGQQEGTWEIKPPNRPAFTKQIEEWAETEVINDKWEKLKASELRAARLSPGELIALEWLVDCESLIEDPKTDPAAL